MRRYDLDWLRVLVFCLLIFYHVGMLFVPWGFHIKNNVIYDWLVYPMSFTNQWRLPILFVISGMGTFYALQKRTLMQFSWERIKRLGIPLLFGMFFIVPPQVYLERLDKLQFNGYYLDFWPSLTLTGIYPEGNFSWHHLWFLPYLLIFSLLLAPIMVYLKNHPKNKLISWISKTIPKTFGFYIFIIPLYLFEAFLEPFFPITHALIDDWFNFVNCITLFFYGFLLVATKDVFWQSVEKKKKYFLGMGIVSFMLLILITHTYEDSTIRHFTEAFIKVTNLWSWVLGLFGYAASFLNKQSKTLSYANEAVYPFYILHQTVMMIIAYYLINQNWSLTVKASILLIGTFGFSWLIYEFLIRRWTFIRPFFGLKNKTIVAVNLPTTIQKNK